MGIFSFLFKEAEIKKEETSDDFDSFFSKELLIDILNASNSMNLVFSKHDGWISANQTFFDTMGYKDIYDFRRQHESIRDLFISESEEVFTEDDYSWLNYVKRYQKTGYNVRLKNKDYEVLEINLKCFMSRSSREIYILEFEDISKLEFAKKQINEVDKLKTKFLTNIGHEFRTPMNGIIGFLELLSTTQLDKVQQEYVELIDSSSKNLMSNIGTLLDLSQMQGGKLYLENEKFDLALHMEELLYQAIMSARDKGVKLLSFIDPKLPKEINADIRKIKQVMNSLIHNAIKSTPRDGRITVEIKLLKRQANGNCSIGFGVRDNGDGISKYKIEDVLKPFNEVNSADEKFGVDLSLAHGLVTLLGSNLHIKSDKGKGSYFNFVIDFNETLGQAFKMISKKKVKVLLLDNTKIDEANFLASYLRSFSVDVEKSNELDENIYDGVEALYIIAKQNDSSWMLKLGTFGKKVPVIILLNEGEKLQTKLTHVIDEVLSCPLFPSRISRQLSKLDGIYLKARVHKKLTLEEAVTVLVVEDNLINQRLMQIMLKEYKIHLMSASNGNEAVEMCKREHFDIVFMDIDMPEKNGIIATKEIKHTVDLNSRTPIIALTAMAMQGDKSMLLKEGLDDYLAKPITREKLEVMLKKYLKSVFV